MTEEGYEVDVFDFVYPHLTGLLPVNGFSSEAVLSAPVLPFATLIETDSYTDAQRQTSALEEAYTFLTYEANIYSPDQHVCRKILRAMDAAMQKLNFRKLSSQFTPNVADPSLFRITARYRGKRDKNGVFYRA